MNRPRHPHGFKQSEVLGNSLHVRLRLRSALLGAAFALAFFVLIARAFWVQCINDGFYQLQGAIRQIRDFRNGLRRSADPRKPNTNTMIELAKAMTDEEIAQAAEYFAAIPWSRRVRVVESPLVPHEDSLAIMRLMDRVREKIGLRYPADDVTV